jgi:outer membrane protein
MSVRTPYYAIRTKTARVRSLDIARIWRTLKPFLSAGFLLAAVHSLHAETLHDALLRAYRGNPTLNAQRTNVLATSENLPRTQAGYLPKINATGDVGLYRQSDTFPDGTHSTLATTPLGAGLSVDQNVFDGFRTANSIRQAQSQILGAQAATRIVEQDTFFAAVSAYMDVLADAAILNRLRKNVNSLKEQLRQTRERHGFGEVTKTDVAQVESRLAGAEAQRSVAEGNLKTSIANYRQIIGVEPKQLMPARSIDQLIPRNLEDAIKIALRENPVIHAASFGISAALLQTEIIRGELLPTVTVSGLLARRHDVNVRGDEQSSASLVGRISVPLYEGGAVSARTSQAKYVATQRTLETDAILDQVRAAASSSWAQFQAAKERIVNAQVQLKAAETALTGIREQWALGDRTMREVLDAEQEFVTAEISLIIAERDRVVASYAIARAVGKLTLACLDGVPLTAAKDSIFEVRSTVVRPRPVEKRNKQACDKDCGTFTEGWTLRIKSQ